MAGWTLINDYRTVATKIPELEKQVLVKYINELNDLAFVPRLAGVEDMANHMLKSQEGKCI